MIYLLTLMEQFLKSFDTKFVLHLLLGMYIGYYNTIYHCVIVSPLKEILIRYPITLNTIIHSGFFFQIGVSSSP